MRYGLATAHYALGQCRWGTVALVGFVLLLSIGRVPAGAVPCDICPDCRKLYVRTCGEANAAECNDANDGLSPQTAWRTLQQAADFINDRDLGNAGDMVIVGPGVYPEGDIDLRRDGIVSEEIYRPVMFLADPSGTCTGDAEGPVVVDAGQQYDTGFLIFGASNVIVSGFHITKARDAGVQIRPRGKVLSDNAVVANNVIFDNGDNCPITKPECPVGAGVQVFFSKNTLVFNNLIYRNAQVGIAVGGVRPTPEEVGGSPGARLINNTIYGHQLGVTVGAGDGRFSPGVWVVNNIIAESAVFGIDVDVSSACDYVGAFNVITGAQRFRYSDETPRDGSDIYQDPRFTAPAQGDFSLNRTSPAIDAGSEDANLFFLDGGSTRPDGGADTGTVDIGYHADSVSYPLIEELPVKTKTLYVHPDGRDTADGLTPDRALKTIRRATEIAQAMTRIVVAPGTYRESVMLETRQPAGPVEFFADASGALTGSAPARVLINAGGQGDGFTISGRCSIIVDGFAVTNASTAEGGPANGIFLKRSHRSVVRNNTLVSNSGIGIRVADSNDAKILNNLVYANGSRGRGGGIEIGGTDSGSEGAVIENNTIYRNSVHGILIGTGGTLPSPRAQVRYNIMAENGGSGLHLDNDVNAGLSAEGLCVEFNINADSYGPILRSNCSLCLENDDPENPCTQALCEATEAGCLLDPSADLSADPGFVQPIGGPDVCVGGARFWDDDFRLSQIGAGQTFTSPGVDFSDQPPDEVGLEMRTTATNAAFDAVTVDAGFHYLPVTFTDLPGMEGDCNGDGRVAINELVLGVQILLEHANAESCLALDPDGDGQVPINMLVMAVNNALCA